MLGVHFAIAPEQERALLVAVDEDELGDFLEELEESWADDSLKVDTDKAWDAIHRCLTDGSLDPDAGDYPLNHAVLGGRHLSEDYYVVYLTAAQTRDVSEALQPIDQGWLRRRFDAIDDPDYIGAGDDEDFDYTWTNFVDVRQFFERAVAAERAVLFTAT
ncbi:YfbM family protein [Paractinoplanes lichenicola]|uniref:YfbM family protein n=1 Tax=Paractinoplanes lichenicola TaxID=2802976 RepID=A0ABS1VZA3_9ACTN|nr:YfbM family protein [Actinoplanes lichenicola]MBL7259753.1 YfbM family protein [Actinoplanes lichenicola]